MILRTWYKHGSHQGEENRLRTFSRIGEPNLRELEHMTGTERCHRDNVETLFEHLQGG